MNQKKKIIGIFALTFLMGLASVNAQQTATATASLSGEFVFVINVTSGGSGYLFAPGVTISGGGGAGAGAYATIGGGAVTSITVTNAGFGYTNTPQVIIAAPSTTPFGSSLVLDLPIDNGTLMDTGPYNLTVTNQDGGIFVPDRFGFAGGAIYLNGTSQNISIPYDARLYPTEFTLSEWVNFQQLDPATLFQVGNAVTDPWRGFALISAGNGNLTYLDFTGSGYNADMTSSNAFALAPGQWYQIVISRTTNSFAMFFNGVKVASQTNLTAYAKPQATALLLGAGWSNTTKFEYCNVTLDSFHLYNRALSDSEVQTLYTDESINTNKVPLVSVVVKTLRVNLSQLVTNYMYQLQSTADFISWTNVGSSFTATNSTSCQDVDIINTAHGYFRILELP